MDCGRRRGLRMRMRWTTKLARAAMMLGILGAGALVGGLSLKSPIVAQEVARFQEKHRYEIYVLQNWLRGPDLPPPAPSSAIQIPDELAQQSENESVMVYGTIRAAESGVPLQGRLSTRDMMLDSCNKYYRPREVIFYAQDLLTLEPKKQLDLVNGQLINTGASIESHIDGSYEVPIPRYAFSRTGIACEVSGFVVALSNVADYVTGEPPASLRIDFNLELGACIAGRVLNAVTREPISGVDLIALKQRNSVNEDDEQYGCASNFNGFFLFDTLPSGSFEIAVDKEMGLRPGILNYEHEVNAILLKKGEYKAVEILLRPGNSGGIHDGKYFMPSYTGFLRHRYSVGAFPSSAGSFSPWMSIRHPMGVIRGRVSNQDGNPIEGVEIDARDPNYLHLIGASGQYLRDISDGGLVTDEQGSFLLDDIPWDMDCRIIALHEEYLPQSIEVLPLSQEDPLREMEIVLQRGSRIRGATYRANGMPAAGVRILLREESSGEFISKTSAFELELYTTEGGNFAFPAIERGSYRVIVIAAYGDLYGMYLMNRMKIPNSIDTEFSQIVAKDLEVDGVNDINGLRFIVSDSLRPPSPPPPDLLWRDLPSSFPGGLPGSFPG